jgi:hypothetical protein
MIRQVTNAAVPRRYANACVEVNFTHPRRHLSWEQICYRHGLDGFLAITLTTSSGSAIARCLIAYIMKQDRRTLSEIKAGFECPDA